MPVSHGVLAPTHVRTYDTPSCSRIFAPDDRPVRRCDTDTLLSRWQQDRDRVARDELVARFLPLARNLAVHYRGSPEPLEDLVQVAALGLLGAIDRFDPARGTPFRAFAAPTIVGELKHHYRSAGWAAHVPSEAQELALRVERAIRVMTTHSGHHAGIAELAEVLELTPDEVRAAIVTAAAHYSVSLDGPTFNRDSGEAGALVDDIGAEDDNYDLVDTVLSVSAAMTELPSLERQALTLRLTRLMTEAEIGRQLSCSQMHVSRLLHRAAADIKRLTDPPLSEQASASRVAVTGS